MALLYALSMLCWWRVARTVGAGPGVAVAGAAARRTRATSSCSTASRATRCTPPRSRSPHSSRRGSSSRATPGRAAAVGLALALLVLIRPVSQILVVLAPLVLLLGRDAWRPRIATLAVLGVAAVGPASPSGRRTTRSGPTTSPSFAAQVTALPLYRAFVVDRIVSPENGDGVARARPRRRRRPSPARAVPLVRDRSRQFFRSGSARMHEDLIGLSDRTWGWDDDYAHLARVGREAVRAHPGAYAARRRSRLLASALVAALPRRSPRRARDACDSSARSTQLPEPSEGQPIPSASVSAFISTPDGRFREVWTSPTEHEIFADDPRPTPRTSTA